MKSLLKNRIGPLINNPKKKNRYQVCIDEDDFLHMERKQNVQEQNLVPKNQYKKGYVSTVYQLAVFIAY